MNDSLYLGMRPGDLDDKPYAKYWNPDMAPMQAHVVDAVLHGAEAGELAFQLDDARQLLEPGYLPLENGYTRLDNGQVFIAVRTDMPGVTGAMFEWWMGWHHLEHQRYKLWHPRSHVGNGTLAQLSDDPTRSDKEKYMTTHFVTEYIADRCETITITFDEPDVYFGQDTNLTSGGTTALVCGRVGYPDKPVTVGHLIHQVRETESGTELRSRFWLGKPVLKNSSPNNPINKILGAKWLSSLLLPKNIGHEMLVHCGMEMNHLASFLPDLYADYHQDLE
ncbi:MAG: hypothetical protein AAF431_09775 [Pseudomonadota bacterium]